MVEYVDRCWFTSGVSGTSDFTDGTAESTYRNLAGASAVNGSIYAYVAVNGTEWEIGTGAYSSGGNSLARTTVIASSTGSKVSFSSAPKVAITLLTSGLAEMSRIGPQDFPVPATGMIPRVTNGSLPYRSETASVATMIAGQEFSASVEQACQFSMDVPKSIDVAASLSGRFRWTTIGGSSGNCIWGIRAKGVSNDDALNGSWGTAVEVTDAFLAAGDDHMIAFSGLAPGGTWAASDKLAFEVYRKAADGSDTLNGTAILTDLMVTFTTNARNDA